MQKVMRSERAEGRRMQRAKKKLEQTTEEISAIMPMVGAMITACAIVSFGMSVMGISYFFGEFSAINFGVATIIGLVFMKALETGWKISLKAVEAAENRADVIAVAVGMFAMVVLTFGASTTTNIVFLLKDRVKGRQLLEWSEENIAAFNEVSATTKKDFKEIRLRFNTWRDGFEAKYQDEYVGRYTGKAGDGPVSGGYRSARDQFLRQGAAGTNPTGLIPQLDTLVATFNDYEKEGNKLGADIRKGLEQDVNEELVSQKINELRALALNITNNVDAQAIAQACGQRLAEPLPAPPAWTGNDARQRLASLDQDRNKISTECFAISDNITNTEKNMPSMVPEDYVMATLSRAHKYPSFTALAALIDFSIVIVILGLSPLLYKRGRLEREIEDIEDNLSPDDVILNDTSLAAASDLMKAALERLGVMGQLGATVIGGLDDFDPKKMVHRGVQQNLEDAGVVPKTEAESDNESDV